MKHWSLRFLGNDFEEDQLEREEEHELNDHNDSVDHDLLFPL